MFDIAVPFRSSRRLCALASLVAVPLLWGAGAAHAQGAGPSAQGLWQGSVTCNKGQVGYDLRLKAMPSGDVFGVVESYSPPDAPKPLPPGSYRVSGHIAEGGTLLLNPVEWIKQPAPNVIMGTLDGKIDGKVYSGRVRECKSGGSFSVTKASDNADATADHANAPAAPAPAETAAAPAEESGGFFKNLGDALKTGLNQMNDPVIVRGYIMVDRNNMSMNPLCLWDLRTKELTGNGVFGEVTQHHDGSPGFRKTRASLFDCRKAAENGLLIVTDYTDMSPEKTPFTAAKGTPALGQTPLMGVFTRTPFDGTPKTYFPRVSVTVTDWTTTPGCWVATAVIWQTAARSTPVGPFNVCWPRNGAEDVTGHLLEGDELMQQINTQVPEAGAGTGNVRTAGPKAPMRGLPERFPASVPRGPYMQFLRALTFGTGWVAGAPTNLWIVGFGPG